MLNRVMPKGVRCLVLLVALVAFSSGEALAVDPAPGGKDAHASHGGAEKNPFAWALDLTIWTSVVFILLFLVLRQFAWKPILEGLHKREQAIHDAQEAAKKERDEAARMREQLQLELSKATEQVRAMLDEARRDAQHTRDEMLATGRAELQAERQRQQRELEITKNALAQDLFAQAAQLATLVSTKVIGRRLDEGDHRRLVDESLGELREALARRRT